MPTTAVQLINVDDGVVMKEYEAGVLIKIGRGPTDQPYIEDNKSTNGTLIEQGNHKIAITSGVQHQLENGQILVFGKEISSQDVIHRPLRLKVNIISHPQPVIEPVKFDLIQSAESTESTPTATQTQTTELPPVGAEPVRIQPASAVRKERGYGMTEDELIEESGSDMNLDTEIEVVKTDSDEEDEDEEEEEIITDGEATGWNDKANFLSSELFRLANMNHPLNSVEYHSEPEIDSDDDHSASDQEYALAHLDHTDGTDYSDEGSLSDFHSHKSCQVLEVESIQGEDGDCCENDYSDTEFLVDLDMDGFSPMELAQFEDDAFLHREIDSDPDEDAVDVPIDDDEPTVTVSEMSQCQPDSVSASAVAVPPPSQAVAERPAGRVPSPFPVPAFGISLRSTPDDNFASTGSVSPLPSPEPSPDRQPTRYFAKRTKPVRVIADDEEEQAEAEAPKPVVARTVFPVRGLADRKIPVSVFSTYGTIRKPKLNKYLGDSEDDELDSQASHLPSPENSPERAPSPELASEPELKRLKVGGAQGRPKVDWTPVVQVLDGESEVEEDEGSVMEGMYDGLDEVDDEEQDGLEFDRDALLEQDELTYEGAAEDASFLELVMQVDKLVEETKPIGLTAGSTAGPDADYKLDIVSTRVTPPLSSTHKPSASPSLSPRKRHHACLDDQAELDQILQDCVAHVAEEARISQLADAATPALCFAAEAEPAAAAMPVSPAADKLVFAPDDLVLPQLQPLGSEARAIAPLPKRAKSKGLLAFLSGMAVAVVGMECIGILAGMLEE